MIRTAVVILSGNAGTALLLLARNLIVARLIPVADYGVAATFALAMAVVEMSSTLGLQQQIVQARDGDDPRFQAVLQGFQLLRGVIAGAVLFALAGPFAWFMGIPEVAWAYRVLALVPILNALRHFDIHRLNRQMRFGPLLLTGLMPALAALVAIWPLAAWFGDWQVMLWSLLIQAVIAALTSHLLAERPWRLAWDRAIIGGSLHFGWPLLLNAGTMFLVLQGDKLIVGRFLGMETLAIFAMGLTLTLTPTLVLARSAQNLFLPRLSAASRGGAGAPDFDRLAQAMLQAAVLNGAVMVLVIGLLGGPLILTLLGEKYAALVPLLPAFAIMNGLRVFKSGPNVVALAAGRTGNAMVSNLPRALALVLAWAILASGGTLTQVLWLAVASETLGYMLALGLIGRLPGLTLRRFVPVMLAALLFLALAALPGLQAGAAMAQVSPWLYPLALSAGFLILAAAMTTLRQDIFRRRQDTRGPQ
jgi:O-antigen/teichoic acid export membrane protein